MTTRSVRLDIRSLVVHYGVVRALQSVSLSLREGEITAIVGLNGAGKSSLIRSIVGLAAPASGEIVYLDGNGEGENILRTKPWNRPERFGIGYVPEGRGLFSRMTLQENLSFGTAIGRRRVGERAVVERLEAVMATFPALRNRGGTVVANLSGGEQQMAAIARALLMEPTVLLLDEPSIGLAPVIEEQMFDVLRILVTQSGLAVLVAEQRLDVALSISDQAYLLERGQIRAEGPPEHLFDDEQLAATYLGGAAA